MRILITFTLLLIMNMAISQEKKYTLRGMVKSDTGEVLSFASISLTNVQNAISTKKETFTDEEGVFTYPDLAPGDYKIEVNTMGFEIYQKQVHLVNDLELPLIELKKSSTALEEITVIGRPKVLERKSDRFVMNVASSSFKADNVLDIFQSLPFMQVRGEEFSLNGKRNILLVVDNVQMPGLSAGQILNSMTGNDIDRIEFITTPGSRYDANIDAVIHIHTKKSQLEGWNGTAVAGFSQGKYGRANTGANLSYRKGKWGFGAKYNFSRGAYLIDRNVSSIFMLSENSLNIVDSETELYDADIHSAKVDVDYTFSNKHNITLSTGWGKRIVDGNIQGAAQFRNQKNYAIDSLLYKSLDLGYSFKNINYSLNYQWTLDTIGKKVEFIATYSPIRNRIQTEIIYQDMRAIDDSLLNSLPLIRNNNPTNADILILQNDWELPFKNKWQMDVGIKYSLSKINSETDQSQRIDDQWILLPDYNFVNHFSEKIIAGYASVQKILGNTTFRGSLRAENTVMGVTGVYERVFFDLFPNLIVQQKIGNRNFMLNYRKTIHRPGFNQMAPWRIYTNEFTIVEGNLNLRPTYTNQIVLNTNVSNNIFLEFEYAKQKDLVEQLARTEDNITILAPLNINGTKWSSNMTYEYKLTPWWNGSVYARGYKWGFNGFVNDEKIEDSGFSYTIGINSSLKLPFEIRMNATYNYQAPEGYAGVKIMQMNFARIGLQKSFLQDRLFATLSYSDIFKGQTYSEYQNTGNLRRNLATYQDNRRVSLGITYNFGKKSVRKVEQKKMGNEEFIDRASN